MTPRVEPYRPAFHLPCKFGLADWTRSAMLGLASTLFASGLVTSPSPRVIMKFGGSSVRDAERIQEVCKLVVNQMEEEGVRPHLVCSAMGKTTNNLLAAAERAINEQVVDLSAVRDLHADTAVKLGLVDSSEYADVLRLLDECERLTLTLARTLALALASASASPSLGASGHSRACRCSASSRRARATAWSHTASGARGANPNPHPHPSPNPNPNPNPHPHPHRHPNQVLGTDGRRVPQRPGRAG